MATEKQVLSRMTQQDSILHNYRGLTGHTGVDTEEGCLGRKLDFG